VKLRFLTAATLGALVVLGALPAAGGGARIPNIPNIPQIPKVPKTTSYMASIDAAGYVEFKWTWDNRYDCVPGYAKTVEEDLSFELGKPQRRPLTVVNGSVIMPFAIGGEAKHKATLSGYQRSNYCPPTPPQDPPPAPTCRTAAGKLGITLLPEESTRDDDELTPLGRGIMATFVRRGGGSQDPSCLENRPTLTALADERGTQIETLVQPSGGLTVPIGAGSPKFESLKRGQSIRRSVKIHGGCDAVATTATPSSLSTTIKYCAVKGRIVVTIKRVG
jgi:hypothetical protein